jgi:PAS domain S-box-containing protein
MPGAAPITLDEVSRSAFSLEQQARLLASLGHAVIATDAAGVIRFWNSAAEQLYGWTASEVIGRDITTVTPGPASADDAKEIMLALGRGESWHGSFLVRRKDGTIFLAEVSDTPVFDDQNTLIGIVGISLDLTARRRSEDRARFLAEAARALAALLAPEDVLAKLTELSIPKFADFSIVYRIAEDGRAHRVASAHVDPERRALIDELERRYPVDVGMNTPVARVLREGESLLHRELHVGQWDAPDEEYRRIASAFGLCSLITVPLVARGRPQGALVLGMTTTQAGGSGRRFEEDDLNVAESLAGLGALAFDNIVLVRDAEKARAQAEEANRAKSAFLASMSHELRTPLNAIAGYVELLEMGLRGPLNEAQRADLARVRRSQLHLTGLIDDVLNFVRLETGHLQFRIDDVPLDSVIQHVEELVRPQLDQKGLRFTRAGGHDLTVRADAEKVRQILANLLTNALKFTKSGGEIALAVAADDTLVRLTVRDTGAGIPEDMLEAIFEPFVQVGRRPSAPAEGVGLGLAISRDLARHMGGDITVESKVGVGSSFTLSLVRA